MAIIPCRECAHQVSDQAASCPSCGAPIAAPPPPIQARPRSRHRLSRVLITLMALWTLGTVLWLIVPRSATEGWIARARSSLQHFDQGIGQLARNPKPQATPAPIQPALSTKPVYRT